MGIGLDVLSDPEVLPANHRRALLAAVSVLTDHFFEDIESLANTQLPARFESTYMSGFLPERYMHRYTYLFAKRFLVCVVTVGWKLRAPGEYLLACTAEELVLNALIQQAETIMELNEEPADFTEFRQRAFEDWDFEYLFDQQWDGVEDYGDEQTGGQMRLVNLRFDQWFLPFRPEDPVHPYAEGSRANV